MPDRPRLGFVGIGLMGAPMVRRLLRQGWSVTVWNREPERYAEVEQFGAVRAVSPAALREVSDVVLFCVLDGHAVEACCFGPAGLAEASDGADLLIDTSTINPATTIAIATRLHAASAMAWVDAPLSGGPEAAERGALTIMMGGDADTTRRASPVLGSLATNLTHAGPLGAGQTAKILNQAIVGTGYLLMAEILALAETTGMDVAQLPACLAGGMADSIVLQRIFPQMQARAYDPPKAYARQLDKDLANVDAFIRQQGLNLPLIQQAVARYHSYAASNPMQDSASIARLYETALRST